MGSLFGRGKGNDSKSGASSTVALDESIRNADSRVRMLDEKIRECDTELMKYKQQLSRLRDGPSKSSVMQRASQVLQKKRQYESQRSMFEQQSFNMSQASFTANTMKDTVQMVNTMKIVNTSMKKELKGMRVEDVEKLHDEMEDMMDRANEVTEAMSRSYNTPDIDDNELESELAMLESDLLDEKFTAKDHTPSYLQNMPSPSTHQPMPANPSVPRGNANVNQRQRTLY